MNRAVPSSPTASSDPRRRVFSGVFATPGAIMGFSFALALLVRASYLFFFRDSPYFAVPIVDAEWHDAWAWEWAQGEWSMGGRAFFRAPLYPFFLSLVYRAAGHDLVAARVVQAVIGAGSAAAIAGCGWRIGGRTAALWSGIAASLFGTLVFYDGELLIPNLLVALLSWALFFLLSAPSIKGYVLAGFLVGMAAIARPNALVLLPLFLFFVWMRTRGGARARAAGVFLCAAAAAIPVGAVTYANFKAERAFVLIASQGGVNFYAGNNAAATGRTAAIEELRDVSNSWNEFVEAARRVAERERGGGLGSREVSDFWAEKAWAWIGDHPLDAMRLNAAKLYYLVHGYETPNNRDLYYERPFPLNVLLWKAGWLYFPWGIVFPLAVVGALVGLRDRKTRGNAGLLAGWVILYGFSLVPFFICARFRMGMVPALILLASFALTRRQDVRRWPILLAGVAAFALVNADAYEMASGDVVRERARRGIAWMRGGRTEKGREELRSALEKRSGAPRESSEMADYAFLLGQSYHRDGDDEQALRYFQRSMELGPSNAGVLVTMANYLAEVGRREEAVRALEKAAVLRPGDGTLWADLGVGYESDGRDEEAVRAFEKSIALDPQNARAYVRLGMVHLRLERPDSAISVWRRGAARVPGEYALRYNLALAWAREGRPEAALEEVNAALALEPGREEAESLRRLIEEEMRDRDAPAPGGGR